MEDANLLLNMKNSDYESDSDSTHSNEDNHFKDIINEWNSKNFKNYILDDIYTIASKVYSKVYNKSFNNYQLRYKMKGFYAFISKLDTSKYNNIDKIKNSNQYKNAITKKKAPPNITNKNELFLKVLTTWSSKNFKTFSPEDLYAIAKNKISISISNGQLRYVMRGFYKYISEISDKSKFSNIDKITNSIYYRMAVKKPKKKEEAKQEEEGEEEGEDEGEDEGKEEEDDEVKPTKKQKTSNFDANYIKSLPYNVFKMLNTLGSINIKGEFIKTVYLNSYELDEINNTEIIINLVNMDVISASFT